MHFQGIASVTYSADDLEGAIKLFADWGLQLTSRDSKEVVFCTQDGGEVRVVSTVNEDCLPKRLPGGSHFREVMFGVRTAADLLAVQTELEKDRPVTTDVAGALHTVDDSAVNIGFKVWIPNQDAIPSATIWNTPPARNRVDKRAEFYSSAVPVKMGHIVFAVPDVERAATFYRTRLGFWLTDSYAGGAGSFLRWAEASEHHNLFLVKSKTGKADIHHVAFEVHDIHEVFGGGLAFSRQGYRTNVGPGRHPISSAYFWYFENPLGGAIEYFSDPDYVTKDWQPTAFTVNRFSEWHLAKGIPTIDDSAGRPSLKTAQEIEQKLVARRSPK